MPGGWKESGMGARRAGAEVGAAPVCVEEASCPRSAGPVCGEDVGRWITGPVGGGCGRPNVSCHRARIAITGGIILKRRAGLRLRLRTGEARRSGSGGEREGAGVAVATSAKGSCGGGVGGRDAADAADAAK